MKVMITGPLGQDGTILTELLQENHQLFGICRNNTDTQRLNEFKKKYQINLISTELCDFNSVELLIKKIKPDVIINFAGETDVINPCNNVLKTNEQNFLIPLNLLNVIKEYNRDIYFFQSSSSLMFARSNDYIINENSKPSPMYPYGITKLSSHYLLNEYRMKFNIKGSSGIFFNHESTYRSQKFITKKISILINKILNGYNEKIKLFDLNFNRDISHANDFMNGVKLIIENKINDDFIFSSGKSTNFLEFSKKFFSLHNLNFSDYIDYVDSNNYVENYNIIGDNTKLKSIGWLPKYDIDELILDMINKEN